MKNVCKTALAVALFAMGNAQAIQYTAPDTPFGSYPGIASPNSLIWTISAPDGGGPLDFQLAGYKTLDGFVPTYSDLFTLRVNGAKTFSGYFNMGGGGVSLVIYNPQYAKFNPISYGFGKGGITDISVWINFQVGGQQKIEFDYTSTLPQGTGDEGWGLNWATLLIIPGSRWADSININSLTPVPEPEEWAMLLLGAGMVAFQVKRKQKQL